MQTCLSDLHLTWCIIYLDDIIVFSKTPEEHLERLEGVFKKLQEAGLKLKPSKCELFKQRITYLGHVVSDQGIETDTKKIEAIKSWPTPVTVTGVRSFLGFANHYRRFIKGYATVARPLNKILAGENSKKKKEKIEWNDECQEAFEQLKELCSTSPVLAYADYSKPFELHTDASIKGLGAVLYQKQDDGKNRVIAFASRSLGKTEKNYITHKLEFLALKWAVTDQFHEYLYGGKFEVHTDNNPLTYVLTSAKLDATGQRWVAHLANYDFSLRYKTGASNVVADALSRIEREEIELDEKTVKAILSGTNETVTVASYAIQLPDKMDVKTMTDKDWVAEQNGDVTLKAVKDRMKREINVKELRQEKDPRVREMLRQRAQLCLRNGVLYRKVHGVQTEEVVMQLVLPKRYQHQALVACHDEVGHLGCERTIDLLRNRFFWPFMQDDAKQHVASCQRCQKFKAKTPKVEMKVIKATYPLELVHIDFLLIESGRNDAKIENILIVTDHFTGYAQAFVTTSQTAVIVAKVLWEKYFVHYGFPTSIISDQGANFESSLISELCKLVGTRKIRTTPYHPQGNGQCERFNSTLISMLGTLPPDCKTSWPQYVSTMTHAYNCTKSNATGFSPFFLMFGRKPVLPIDLLFGQKNSEENKSHQKYVQELEKKLKWAYEKAQQHREKEQNRHADRHNRKVKCAKLEKGDVVLLKREVFKGKHKIQDKWQNELYEIVGSVGNNLPVFRIKQIGGNTVKVVHRSKLLSIPVAMRENFDIGVVDTPEKQSDLPNKDQPKSEVNRPVTRSQTKAQNQQVNVETDSLENWLGSA
jgi:transposase InsO family protein